MQAGIIGIGFVAQAHIQSLINLGYKIKALCDTERDKCEKANLKYGLSAEIFSDYREMIKSVKLDVIHICTPHYLHAEMIIAGLTAGINVLCEKPVAINKEQIAEIEKAVKSSKAQLGVCFQNRYNAASLYVKNYLKDKKILSAAANLVWERNAEYYSRAAWRGTKKFEGGGVMINQAIHGLDFLQWVCGMPVSVIGNTANYALQGVIDVEDTAFGIYYLKDGTNFVISATNAATYSFPVYFLFRTETETVELSADNIIIDGKFLEQSEGLPMFGKEEWGTGHIKLIKDYYDCIKTGRKFPIGIEEAKNTVILIRGLYESNGKKLDV